MAEQVSSLKTNIKYKNTPVGKIPVDWEVVKLEDICDEIYRYPTYYNIKYVQQDGVPEVRGELIEDNGELSNDPSAYRYISKETSLKFPRTILRQGDFVLSVRGTMGKIGFVSSRLENANMTANLMRISPNRNKVFSLWLKQYFLSNFFQTRLNEASSATTIKTIKAPELKTIELALPLLSEQKKIAEILTAVDEAIEKTDQIIEKTKETKKGLMQKLLTRGIGHKKFKKTEIGEMPEEWEVVKLGIVADLKNGINFGKEQKTDTGILTIDVLNMYSASIFIDPTNLYRISIDLTKKEDYLLKEGDVLFVRSSLKKEGVGWVSLFKDFNEQATFCGFIIRARIHTKKLIPAFLTYFLRSDRVRERLISGAGQVAITNISQATLEHFIIVVPPLNEQEQIIQILSSIDEEIEKETTHKEELELLKKGLMQVLLTGKIRVPA